MPQQQKLQAASPPSDPVELATSPQYLFTYGTLKTGFENHDHYLKHDYKVGPAMVPGLLLHLGTFPALTVLEQPSKVVGEVYKISWRKLLDIDMLEGHPTFYKREKVIIDPYGEVWTYILPRDWLHLAQAAIPMGCWVGPSTPMVKWLGLGKGVAVTPGQRLQVVDIYNKEKFRLEKNTTLDRYELIDKATGEIVETYKSVGEMVRPDNKPRITLPAAAALSREARGPSPSASVPTIISIPKEPPPPPRSYGPRKREA